MKLFLRYLMFRFGKACAIALAGFMSLFIFSGFITRLSVFSEYGASASRIAYFLACKSPAWFLQALPVAVLLALVTTITTLKRHNELTAIETSGVPMTAVIKPFLAAGAVLSAVMFLTDEFVAKMATSEAYRYYNVVIKGQSAPPPQGKYFNLLYHSDDEDKGKFFYHIGFYDSAKKSGSNFNLDIAGENEAVNVLAKTFTYKDRSGWELRNGVERKWNKAGELTEENAFKSRIFAFEQKPADFLIKSVSYHDMGIARLARHIEELRAAGIASHEETLDFHARISSALSAVVVILIGFPIGIYFSHLGRTFAVALSMAVCFTYWGLYSLGLSFGQTGGLPPWLGAWGINIIFSAAALYFMRRKNV